MTRVLVVEDVEALTRALGAALAGSGFVVDEAENGERAQTLRRPNHRT